MKKIFYFIASAIVALGAVACDNQDLDNIAPGAKGEGLTITATIDEATKVAFEGMQAKSWEEGDFITVGDFKFDYVPAEDVFRCTDEGVFGLADGTTKYTAYANELNSAAGIKGSTFVSTEAKLIDQNVSFVFKLNSALLKYTTTEKVTFDGIALSESFTVTGDGTTQYIAVKAGEEVTISYSINGAQCKSTTKKFDAGKVYNLGTLEAPAPEAITIEKFNKKSKDLNIYYELTGCITNIANSQYGNLTINDGTASVYVYGMTKTKLVNTTNDQSFAKLGLNVGDVVTLHAIRNEYNGSIQAGGTNGSNSSSYPAYYISHYGISATAESTSIEYTGGSTTITVKGTGTGTLPEAISYTADGDASVTFEGNTATVSFDENTGEEKRMATITFTCGLATQSVNIEQAAKMPEGVVAGGRADFETITSTNTSYVTSTSTAGWKGVNCAVFKGGTSDSSPAFKMIGAASNRALCMNGKTSAKGIITSPTLTTGCGTLKFKYGLPFSDTKINFKVEIIQNGTTVKKFTIQNTSASKLTTYSHEEAINIAGNFSIKFSNLSPSNSTSNKDRTAIWDVEWTGYAE